MDILNNLHSPSCEVKVPASEIIEGFLLQTKNRRPEISETWGKKSHLSVITFQGL